MTGMIFSTRQVVLAFSIAVVLGVNLLAQTVDQRAEAMTKERAEAERLWEQMVDAKGGRKKLYAITNMMVTKGGQKTDFTQVQFYVYPDRFWEWSKGRIAGRDYLDVTMANLERGVFTVVGLSGLLMDKKNLNQPGGAPFGEGYLMDSCSFLLETKWLQPTPVRVTRQAIGKERFDVVETRYPSLSEYKDWRADFYIDPESLVVRGVASYTANGQMFEYFSFENYISVNGVEMPTRYAVSSEISAPRSSTFVPLRFQFDVKYSLSLFETTPSPQIGPDAWKPRHMELQR